MKARLAIIEQYLLTTAVVMFFSLCAISLVKNGGSLLVARNMLFLFSGVAGFYVASELGEFQKMRISIARKRVLRIAQTLLIVFSTIASVYALFELDLIAGLNRWD
jgi:hypothetical protein